MQKQQAINIVRETFESAFDKVRFTNFIKNLLNEPDLTDGFGPRSGQYIPDAYKGYVEKYERLGKYEDEDEKRIDILIVHLKRDSSIERARSMQRNFVAGYLQGKYGSDAPKDAALVAFVSPNGEDWRFSLVKLEVRLDANDDGKLKVTDEFTPAKRWSFLVGSQEKSHTAQRQFVPIMQDTDNNPTLAQLEEAFNIETVTKEFFNAYRALFIRTKGELDKLVKKDARVKADFESKGIDTVNLAKKLLGQIVFLYYLQKKGWFGVPRDAAWGEGSRAFLRELFEKKHGEYKNFFNDVLEPLFYEALRIDRSHDDHYYSRFDCKIPFLNGGLFDPMNNYDWVKTDLLLPNELFSNRGMSLQGRSPKQSAGSREVASQSALATTSYEEGDGILDVFDLYNFTVKEDEPFEKEVAIDPELLGKAYEKFNAIRPDNYAEFLKALESGKKGEESKFNKQYGVYYTPREIVHYMCQQSLINYLFTEVSGDTVSGDTVSGVREVPTKEEIALLIQHGENWRENEEQVLAKGKETRDYKYKIPESIRMNAALLDEKLAAIKVCDPAVGSGAFPVGMMSEIVKARDVLTTFVTPPIFPENGGMPAKRAGGRSVYQFKRECIENSLYGVDIDSGAVEIAKLRLWLSLVVDEDDPQNIKPLPNLDYKVVQGNSLIGVEKNLFNNYLFSELEALKPLFFNATTPAKKQEYKRKIDALINQITNGGAQFDFEIYFSEVFHQKNGFDILIANPPYVGNKGHKDEFQRIQKSYLGEKYYERRMDILYFFFHLSLNLARDGASIAFITTNYYPTATGARKLRKDFKERATIKNLINFNEFKIFESALGQHNMITVLQKGQNTSDIAQISIVKKQGLATEKTLDQIFSKQDQDTSYHEVKQKDIYDGHELYIRLTSLSSNKSDNRTQTILEKLKQQGDALENFCSTNQGIVSGSDKVSKKHLEKFKLKADIGEGIYILTPEEIKNKNINLNSEHVKPWFKNSDIRPFWTNTKIKEYVLYFKDLKSKQPIDKEILQHFKKYEELLIARLSVCKKNEFQWNIVSKWIERGEYYLLFYPRKQEIFESEKIVAPQRSQRNSFGYNNTSWYASADVYFIRQKNNLLSLKYILALLNSKLYYLWLYHRGKRKGETLELYQKPLSEIPIKKISTTEQQPFIKLVDRILAAKGKNPQADTSKEEKEIDQLVYQLYGLTEDEVKIVEGKE